MDKLRHGKKRQLMLGVVLAGMLMTAWTAHADNGIKVVIEGEEVQFEKDPVAEQGAALVPFRVLFEKLGLSVDWIQPTKTIIGRGEGVTIELQLDRKTALVNGDTVEMTTAPRIIDGSTYVPLRLVGEATGRLVNWDGSTRTITIGAAPSAQMESAEDFDFEGFYRAFLAAGNAENIEAIRSALHPDSPLNGESLDMLLESFRSYDIVTELVRFEVIEANASSALLRTVEKYTNANGLFYPDNQMEMQVELIKDEHGEWKIYSTERLELTFLVSEEALREDADIDEALERAVLDVVAAHIEALEAEDFEAASGTYDPAAPELDWVGRVWRSIFLHFDLEYDLEYSNVIQVADTEAFVYTVQAARKMNGFDYEGITDSRTRNIYHLRKQSDGTWKIYETIQLSTEPLEQV